jgi:hypothetical protein
MSKGLGQIEKAIAAILDAEPTNAFTTTELCMRIFPGTGRLKAHRLRGRECSVQVVEQKCRIAVIRAGKKLSEHRPEVTWFYPDHRDGNLVFGRRDNLQSYATGCLKAMYYPLYSDTQVQEMLAGDGKDYFWREQIKPDGRWALEVSRFLTERV